MIIKCEIGVARGAVSTAAAADRDAAAVDNSAAFWFRRGRPTGLWPSTTPSAGRGVQIHASRPAPVSFPRGYARSNPWGRLGGPGPVRSFAPKMFFLNTKHPSLSDGRVEV